MSLPVVLFAVVAAATAASALGVVLSRNIVRAAVWLLFTLIGVSLFVPILAGLFVPRTSSTGALATMVAGVCAALAVHVATAGRGWGPLTPAIAGLASAGIVWVITLLVPRNEIRKT